MIEGALLAVFLVLGVIGIALSFFVGFPNPMLVVLTVAGYFAGIFIMMSLDVSSADHLLVAGFPIPTGMMLDFSIGYWIGAIVGIISGLFGGA